MSFGGGSAILSCMETTRNAIPTAAETLAALRVVLGTHINLTDECVRATVYAAITRRCETNTSRFGGSKIPTPPAEVVLKMIRKLQAEAAAA